MQRNSFYIASALLAASVFSQARTGANSGTAAANPKAALRQIEANAANAASEAAVLEEASREASLNWETHNTMLNRIKADFHQMNSEISALESEQETLAPWEREAMGKAVPLLKDAASNTDQAINFLRDEPLSMRVTGPYRAYTVKIEKDCAQAARILQDYLKLNRTVETEKEVRQRLTSESGS